MKTPKSKHPKPKKAVKESNGTPKLEAKKVSDLLDEEELRKLARSGTFISKDQHQNEEKIKQIEKNLNERYDFIISECKKLEEYRDLVGEDLDAIYRHLSYPHREADEPYLHLDDEGIVKGHDLSRQLNEMETSFKWADYFLKSAKNKIKKRLT